MNQKDVLTKIEQLQNELEALKKGVVEPAYRLTEELIEGVADKVAETLSTKSLEFVDDFDVYIDVNRSVELEGIRFHEYNLQKAVVRAIKDALVEVNLV